MHSQRVAALSTISEDGNPCVSMVPYAMEPSLGCLVIHVSGLAAHTGNLQARPNVSLLVMQAEVQGESVHDLPRVTLDGVARTLEAGTPAWETCQTAYVKRFSEAQFMTQLGDFRFVAIELNGARQVAGFGAARSIDEDEVRRALVPAGQ